ncbi:MAG: alpha/beta hydrolase, partial [Kordiimonas sp.]
LNQTIKMPHRTDAYFDRLQQAVNTQPEANQAYPNIKGLMRRVHRKLESNPMSLKLKMRDGTRADYLLERHDIQRLASGAVSDPSWVKMLLGLYLAIDADFKAPLEDTLGHFIDIGEPISMRAMSTAMDIASGMTEVRKQRIGEQAKTALLRDYLNFTYHYDGIAPDLDLGDTFRTKPVSDLPVLLFSGTLDGRTYIESQLEAVEGLSNLTAITVKNAGHNLYMSSPDVQKTINRFMENKPIGYQTIIIDLPDMAPPK